MHAPTVHRHFRLMCLLYLIPVWLTCFAGCSGTVCAENAQPATVPQRIVAIAPNTAEIICDLGACDSIVGVSKFCVFPPQLKSRTLIGGLYDLDLEAIVSLRPELLVSRGQHDSLERLAEQLDIPVYHDETDSLDGMERTVLDLGTLLGHADRARFIVEEFRADLRRIRSRVESRPKVRVLLTVSRSPDRLANVLTAGRGTFLNEMIELAGGVNVFGDVDMRYPEISVESVIARQPECILELMPEVDADRLEERLREQWRAYPMIPAVALERIHVLSDDNALIPSPRYARFIDKVSRILHPHEKPQ